MTALGYAEEIRPKQENLQEDQYHQRNLHP